MASYITEIQKLYIAYFNRPGDVAGVQFWDGVVAGAQGDTSAVSAAFASSDEYRKTFAGKSNADIVRTVYQNLFGREAEPAGVAWWADALNTKVTTIDSVVTVIASGAQGTDLDAFNNKVAAAKAFTAALDTYPESAAYGGDDALAAAKAYTAKVTDAASLAAATAPDTLAATVAAFVQASKMPLSFTLSSGADSGVAFTGGGGNDVFNATGATWSAGDVLQGGGGVNTLTVTDTAGALGAGLPAGAQLSNIQQAQFSTTGGFGGATAYDLSGAAGLQSVSVQAKGAINLRLSDTAAATLATTSGGVTVNGGKSVAVDGNTAAAVLTGDALATVKLANTSQAATIVNKTAGHTLNLTVKAVTNKATITDAAAGAVKLTVEAPGSSDFNLDTAKATSLDISDAGAFTLTTTALAAADQLKAITLRGTGDMKADLSGILPFNSFDGSGFAGSTDLIVASASGIRFTGGTGSDKVVLTNGLSATGNFDLGQGADSYTFTTAAAAGAKVAGGAGSDTMVVNDGKLLDAAAKTVYSGFEILDFSSGLHTYDLAGAGGATSLITSAPMPSDVTFINALAGTSITFYSQAEAKTVYQPNVSLTLADSSGANDTLPITLVAVDGVNDGAAKGSVQAHAVLAKGIETVRVTSTVQQPDADLVDTPVNEATQAGQYSNELSYLFVDHAKSVYLDGGANLTIENIYSDALTLIDASAASGNILLSGATRVDSTNDLSFTYLGSAGGDDVYGTDAIIVYQGNGGADQLHLKAGNGSDLIKFAKGSDSTMTAPTAISLSHTFDTIDFFETGSDRIDLSQLHLAQGANTGGIAKHTLLANNEQLVAEMISNTAGFFNDGDANRSLAFATDGMDGFLFVDINADGNYTPGTDMAVELVGTSELVIGDVKFA